MDLQSKFLDLQKNLVFFRKLLPIVSVKVFRYVSWISGHNLKMRNEGHKDEELIDNQKENIGSVTDLILLFLEVVDRSDVRTVRQGYCCVD